jgi:hypothetical protein
MAFLDTADKFRVQAAPFRQGFPAEGVGFTKLNDPVAGAVFLAHGVHHSILPGFHGIELFNNFSY